MTCPGHTEESRVVTENPRGIAAPSCLLHNCGPLPNPAELNTGLKSKERNC